MTEDASSAVSSIFFLFSNFVGAKETNNSACANALLRLRIIISTRPTCPHLFRPNLKDLRWPPKPAIGPQLLPRFRARMHRTLLLLHMQHRLD
uniref:Uncharacterized protein n=1 Tax=Arundo donax TaxID=35708 RepID=A0A0A9D6K4_ARUDO